MSEEYSEQQVDRRGFMKAVAVTAVAATATGVGAALLQKSNQPASTISTSSLPPAPQTFASANNQVAELLAQLAAAQAENVRLQANLDSAQRRWEAIQRANGETGAAMEALSVELDSAHERIGLLAGLVALYEQLDDVDITALLEAGMDAVAEALADVTDDLPGLSAGVAIGRQALAELDDHIPSLEDGRNWLTDQAEKLQIYFTAIESLLETAVESAGAFLQMFNEWVQKILKWLPFGLGQRTSAIMDALTDLLLETPQTVAGLQTNVAEPLAVWLGSDGDEAPLRRKIVKPLREQVLTKADQVVDKTRQVQFVYHAEIARPVGTAVANYRHIRNLITSYRQQRQI